MLFDLFLFSAITLADRTAAQSQPCAAVRSASASFMAALPSATAAYVPAAAAQACLKSVPIDATENKALLDELLLYLSWQSNIKYILDPPDSYTEESVDIEAKINDVYNKLDNGTYDNEYDFQFDVWAALTEAYDFHLYFQSDIMSLFKFMRGNWDNTELFDIVSLSSDGTELPKLYNYFDIIKINDGESFTPSPIVEINNQTANDYLNEFAKYSTYHDKDARYNRMFPNQAAISYGQKVNEFILSYVGDGASTFVVHENGTTFNYGNYAKVNQDFSNINTGKDVYDSFLNQGPPQTSSKRSIVKRATAIGYPDPVILHSEAVVGGYYLTGTGYEDVAVLSIPSFSPEARGGAVEFQNTVASFFKDATSNGKKKLIIDLRANGGGRVFLGYDLFKQLFPKMDPYGGTRFRANDAFNAAGIAMTEVLKKYTYDQALADANSQSGGALATAWRSIFNYKLPKTEDGKSFSSWADLFGPHVFNNDNFTSIERYDFNNALSDDLDMDVSGYGTRADALGNQPFEAANIVMLQDGGCGSTCAVFAELAKAQGNVQQIVMGGQPKTGPMQGVAGSKGAQVWNFQLLYQQAYDAYSFLTDYQDQLNNTEIGQLVRATRPLKRVAYASDGTPIAAINLRDNIRKGDTTQTPLEFVYEAADCKLWYTAGMYADPTLVWKAAADAKWSNNKGCVDGSVGDKSSISGGVKLPGDSTTSGKKSATSVNTSSFMGLALAVVASMMVVAF